MKQWIEENKYVATLIGITAVLVILASTLIYLALSKKWALEVSVASKSQKIKGIKTKYGMLTPEVVEAFSGEINEGVSAAVELHSNLLPEENKLDESLSATDFDKRLKKFVRAYQDELKKANITFPADTMFGFEKYKESLIKENPKAIGLCLYQMNAFMWVFDEIKKLGPSKLKGITRTPLIEESQEKTPAPKEYAAVRRMRFDFVMELSEVQLSQLMATFANASKYRFVIKALRVDNLNAKPRLIDPLMSGEVVAGSEDLENGTETGFFFPEEEENTMESGEEAVENIIERVVTVAPEPDELILKQVLGSENVKVAFAMELIRLADIENLKIKEVK